MTWVYAFWFFAAVLVLLPCAFLFSKALPPKLRYRIGGALIAVFIAYVVMGFGYAVITGQSHMRPDDGQICPGAPYSTC